LRNLKKIIHVDDQLDILLVSQYALSEIGEYDVLICESGAEALEKIEDYNPDLILLDVMMPRLDGPQTLSKIREIELFESTPVIFLTAKIFPNEIAELLACDEGVLDVIPKPFDPVTISDTIQAVWNSSFLGDNKRNDQRLQ